MKKENGMIYISKLQITDEFVIPSSNDNNIYIKWDDESSDLIIKLPNTNEYISYTANNRIVLGTVISGDSSTESGIDISYNASGTVSAHNVSIVHEWILQDGSVYNGNIVTTQIIGAVGDIVQIKCRGTDEYGNKGLYVTKDITIV